MEVMEFTGPKDVLTAAAVFIEVAAEHLFLSQHSNPQLLRKKSMLVGNQIGDNSSFIYGNNLNDSYRPL